MNEGCCGSEFPTRLLLLRTDLDSRVLLTKTKPRSLYSKNKKNTSGQRHMDITSQTRCCCPSAPAPDVLYIFWSECKLWANNCQWKCNEHSCRDINRSWETHEASRWQKKNNNTTVVRKSFCGRFIVQIADLLAEWSYLNHWWIWQYF